MLSVIFDATKIRINFSHDTDTTNSDSLCKRSFNLKKLIFSLFSRWDESKVKSFCYSQFGLPDIVNPILILIWITENDNFLPCFEWLHLNFRPIWTIHCATNQYPRIDRRRMQRRWRWRWWRLWWWKQWWWIWTSTTTRSKTRAKWWRLWKKHNSLLNCSVALKISLS